MNKKNLLLYLCIALFGIVGIYLTFISGNTDKYDSQIKAYRIYPNERSDSDSITYQPIYYFRVNGQDYECKTTAGSSSYPSESKNTVYYDSSDPTKCKTEYEKSSSKFAGIICLIATVVMIYFFVIKKTNSYEEYNQKESIDMEKKYQFEQENAEKMIKTIEKIQLIYKRVILGIIIAILIVLILIDTAIVKQTIVSKDYLEATALYVNKKSDEESNVFDDCVYTFVDKEGRQQEIIISVSKDTEPKQEIKLKYNENNPQDYYEEGSTMDKSGIIWYIVKVVMLVLLIILFCNKKILSKINIFTGK